MRPSILKAVCLVFLVNSYAGFTQILLRPDRVFDGENVHENWVVLTKEEAIVYVGPEGGIELPENTQIYSLPGKTLLPGIIEGHSHLLLHPYNETAWNDQVLKESPEERAIRGVIHAEKSLMAGVTTMRDLCSQRARYADVALKKTIEEGLLPGPRLLVAGPAIGRTGAYGPKSFPDGGEGTLRGGADSGID